GSGSYSVSWNTVPVTNGISVSGLAPGLYTVSVNDNNGCSETKSHPVTILGATSAFELALEITSISCNGSEDGAIDLVLSGGQGPYSHTWSDSNGLSTGIEDLVDLGPDTYSLVAIDGFGCRIDTSVTLTEPSVISIAGSITTAACLGTATGAVEASVNGGTAPYSFAWSGPDGYTSSDEDIQDLPAGIYTLLVTDDNGCTSSEAFNVNQPGSLEVNVTPFTYAGGHGVSCANATDGSIALDVSGGTAPYVIAWTGPNAFSSADEDINNLAAGTYNVTVTDDNGCAFQQQVVLTTAEVLQLETLTSAFIGGYEVSCYGADDGSVDLTIMGGTAPFSILWSEGAGFSATTEDIEAIGPGNYSVLVTDANGCTQSASVEVDGPTVLDLSAQLSLINGNNVSCAGATDGSIDLSVVGGVAPYSYTWNNGSADQDLANISSGTFDVTVTDQNGCEATASFTLTAPLTVQAELLASTFPNGTQISCGGAADGSIDASITGGTSPYTIAWTGPDGFTASTTEILDLTIGDYTLSVTDANGCESINTTSISGPEPLAMELSSVTYSGGYNIPCSETSIGVLSAQVTGGMPGFTYAWSGPDGFTSTESALTMLEAGTYDLVVTDVFGCTTSGSATLTSPNPLNVVLEFTDFSGSQVSCTGNDGGITLTVSGGTAAYTFDWNGPDGFASQLEDLSDLGPGDYTLIVHDANGCSLDTTVTLVAPEPLNAAFISTANDCANGNIGSITTTLTGGGEPYQIAWTGPNGFSANDADLSDLTNGTYTLTVSDALGCSMTQVVELEGPAPISTGTYVSFYGQYNIQCEGDSTGVIELDPQGGMAPYTVTMIGPDGFSSNSLSNIGLVAGAYDVNLIDHNGCVLDTTIVLSEPDNGVEAELALSLYPSGTNVSCYGASDGSIDATVTGGTGPYVFSWRGPDSLEFVTEDVSGLPAGDYAYELVVTDANQCSFFTTVTLTQPDTSMYMSSVLSVYEGGSNTTCSDATNGAIDLIVAGGSGGYTFAWSGPNGFGSTEQDITDLLGGSYAIAITDINGCLLENTIEVVAPEELAPTLQVFTHPGGTAISCNGMLDG
ncbi:MAG: SprB repeat-containing protein, partial [Flavobacteriales bacterium]|nr:SprB repeat-containing protein [Flavobacteriales bacterium]